MLPFAKMLSGTCQHLPDLCVCVSMCLYQTTCHLPTLATTRRKFLRHMPTAALANVSANSGWGWAWILCCALSSLSHHGTPCYSQGDYRLPSTYPHHARTPGTSCTPDCLHFPPILPSSPQLSPSFPVSPFLLRYIMDMSHIIKNSIAYISALNKLRVPKSLMAV